jgi:hypothetical protein
MSAIKVDYNILNQKQTPSFYASSLATRPTFGYPGRIFIDTDTPSSGIYRDTGSAWVQVADPGAGTTGTLQQVTTNGNTTTLGISVQGIDINDGAGTGANNLAIGSSALVNNTTGNFNTALGSGSLQSNTTGANNVGLGYQSLNVNTTGGANTGIGYNSLQANTTGGSNTAIGSQTLKSNTTASFNTAIGNNSLQLNTIGTNNTAVGYASLPANTTGSNNTTFGSNSLAANTTASENTAVGSSSLSANTTGASNTAVGFSSLLANTTGDSNTAIGSASLQTNISGSNNTAIGYAALNLNTGAQNTAIGNTALQNNSTGASNVGIGHITLLANTTGGANTGIGRGALTANTTGTFNTAIGYGSGGLITTGGKNSILGSYAGTTTLTNHIVLSDGDANVRLFSDANGLIGIGQAVGTPGGQLDIHTTQTYALVLNGLSTSNAYIAFSNASVGQWRIGNTYNAGANTFNIFNLGTSSNALSFNKTTNNATFTGSVTASSLIKSGGTSVQYLMADGSVTTGGVSSLSAIGSTANANGATITGSVLNLQPASASFGGVVTTGLQNFAGVKVFGSSVSATQFFAQSDNATTSPNQVQILGLTNSNKQLLIGYNTTGNGYGCIQPIFQGVGNTNLVLNPLGGNVLIASATDDTINKLQVTGRGKFTGAIAIGNTVTASVSSVVTNKVSVLIGGVQYYLLASTSAV